MRSKSYLLIIIAAAILTGAMTLYITSCEYGTLHEHDWDDWIVSYAPTCQDDGLETRYCKLDPLHIETAVIPANDNSHVFAISTFTPGLGSICKDGGTESGDCYICKESKVNIVGALGHDFDPWEIKDPATCVLNGVRTRSCSRECGESDATENVDIPALGHNWGVWGVSIPATCLTDGEDTRTCSRVGCLPETETRPVVMLGHNYSSPVTIPATCTTDGSITGTCARCGDYDEDVIDALGHAWGVWVVTTPATCLAEGEETSTCTRSGCLPVTDTRPVSKLEHDFLDPVIVDATCTTAGSKTGTCSICDDDDVEVIPALGHDWGDWEETTPATCTVAGVETRNCKRDCEEAGATETRTIGALGHDWGDWEETTAPTCTVAGIETRSCTVCGATDTRAGTPATGHDIVWTVTCSAPGVDHGVCSHGCGETDTQPGTGDEPCIDEDPEDDICDKCGEPIESP